MNTFSIIADPGAIALRPYQETAVNDIRATFANWLRVLFVLPTGGGKTVIFTTISLRTARTGKRVVIVAHRAEIIDQISNAMAQMGVRHGRIQAGHPMTSDLVQVGMVQTVARRLGQIAPPALLIVDEAHHAVATTWAKIIAAWPRAYVLGVTATPERLDGKGLGDIFQTMVLGPTLRELIDGGYLADYRYLAPPTKIDLSGVGTVAGDYNTGDLEKVLSRAEIIGDVVKHYFEYLNGKTAVVFCATIAHARQVAQRFNEARVPAAVIDGKMSPEVRRELVAQLRAGRLKVLTSCDLISEGFDVPAVNGAVLLRPTKSRALHRQQIGRALRLKPDGSPAVILDHVGNVAQHGLPDDRVEWSLEGRPHNQAADKPTTPSFRRCSSCHVVFPAGTGVAQCPRPDRPSGCLFPPRQPLQERDGVLREVTSPTLAASEGIRQVTDGDRGPPSFPAELNPRPQSQPLVPNFHRRGKIWNACFDPHTTRTAR